MTEQLTNYPYPHEADTATIRQGVHDHAKALFAHPLFSNHNNLGEYFGKYLSEAESLFKTEEDLRNQGVEGANLYYHSKEHAVFQTTYDAITLTRAVLSRNDAMSSHLTPESTLAIPIAAMFHDAGYVYKMRAGDTNYAARQPIHVEESARAVGEKIDEIGLPQRLDQEKVKTIARIGILNTYFPFTNEMRMAIKILTDRIDVKTRKETHIARLAVQFADLGGQVARVDHLPKMARRLRDEVNEIEPGKGTASIGTDDEIVERAARFIEHVVKPTVGKTGAAIFLNQSNPFLAQWEQSTKI